MRFSINVPDFGAGDETIRLCGWLVDVGDLVLAGDLVAEVLIPGISFEIMAESTGRLIEILKPIDSTVKVGDVIGWLEEGEIETSSNQSFET
jgi:pyruvate/2-oxoglutarate dehydrogenase complex dihydrolipoamide acyltransferase (E2) component